MASANLSELFSAVAYRLLSEKDLATGEGPFELRGALDVNRWYGEPVPSRVPAAWHYYKDDYEPRYGDDMFTFESYTGSTTSREHWRIHYHSNISRLAFAGDTLVLAVTGGRYGGPGIQALIAADDSGWLRVISKFFGLKSAGRRFHILGRDHLQRLEFDFIRRMELDLLEVSLATLYR